VTDKPKKLDIGEPKLGVLQPGGHAVVILPALAEGTRYELTEIKDGRIMVALIEEPPV
jgi:hypothetical protein